MSEFATAPTLTADHTRALIEIPLEEIQAARAAAAERLSSMFTSRRTHRAVGTIAVTMAHESEPTEAELDTTVRDLAVGEQDFNGPKRIVVAEATRRPTDLYPGPTFFADGLEAWEKLDTESRNSVIASIDLPEHLGIGRKVWKKWTLEERAQALHHRYVRDQLAA